MSAELQTPAADNIRLRIISSIVLMAFAIGAAELGTIALAGLGAILGTAMAFEWVSVVGPRRVELPLGLLYIAGAGISLVALRAEPHGAAIILWLFALTWAGDTGAYIIGRRLGRHALERFSNKTWEGFFGGVAAASIAGVLFAPPLDWSLAERVLVSAALAVVAQLGDLLESAAKRRFGVKDMSGLVPGHGGVLDRLDSLLLVLLVTGAAFAVLHGVAL